MVGESTVRRKSMRKTISALRFNLIARLMIHLVAAAGRAIPTARLHSRTARGFSRIVAIDHLITVHSAFTNDMNLKPWSYEVQR